MSASQDTVTVERMEKHKTVVGGNAESECGDNQEIEIQDKLFEESEDEDEVDLRLSDDEIDDILQDHAVADSARQDIHDFEIRELQHKQAFLGFTGRLRPGSGIRCKFHQLTA